MNRGLNHQKEHTLPTSQSTGPSPQSRAPSPTVMYVCPRSTGGVPALGRQLSGLPPLNLTEMNYHPPRGLTGPRRKVATPGVCIDGGKVSLSGCSSQPTEPPRGALGQGMLARGRACPSCSAFSTLPNSPGGRREAAGAQCDRCDMAVIEHPNFIPSYRHGTPFFGIYFSPARTTHTQAGCRWGWIPLSFLAWFGRPWLGPPIVPCPSPQVVPCPRLEQAGRLAMTKLSAKET